MIERGFQLLQAYEGSGADPPVFTAHIAMQCRVSSECACLADGYILSILGCDSSGCSSLADSLAHGMHCVFIKVPPVDKCTAVPRPGP